MFNKNIYHHMHAQCTISKIIQWQLTHQIYIKLSGSKKIQNYIDRNMRYLNYVNKLEHSPMKQCVGCTLRSYFLDYMLEVTS